MGAQLSVDECNWAGNYRYSAPAIHHPQTLAELSAIVAASTAVRALGSRHSFNAMADSAEALVCLDQMPTVFALDTQAQTVSVNAGMTYGVLAQELTRRGFALHNLASLPHISVAGAIATGTHGSGDGNGNLATAVLALRFVDGQGREHAVSQESTQDFAGYVVGLGALGIVTEVTLRIEKGFTVAQHVYEQLPWADVLEKFDDVTSCAYSVSLFTNWRGDKVGQAWLKQRTDDGKRADFPEELFGGKKALQGLHPLPGVGAESCTEQLGQEGPWSDRLAHFKMDYSPSNGAEIQSEYLVAREHAVAAMGVMRHLGGTFAGLLLVAEVRTIAADELWLSGNYGRDGIGLHFTWRRDQQGVDAILPVVEAALLPFAARPHWGKAFHMDAGKLATLYPRFEDFRKLASRVDPAGKFRNEFLEKKVFGA